ncbi:reverse transcriptase domain, Reverse transcriptase zinc-binding domain protein [Artemisia annua]|uniref:Reverse transcriptase domain, Reverse transcriptase zinc-binding domain protein n=1 Tax=Artemisia annua TaxID=35608 RepID=A0A2U1NP63_ARTAN|nr:reverse transcriptase domain, Reverse transcriptase zinc-binding domain protein [Artemisia annua]
MNFCEKDKAFEEALRNLLIKHGNLHERVIKLRHELDMVQKALETDLSSIAKVEWLRAGDSNSAYFHRMVKARLSRIRIDSVAGLDNVINEGTNVPQAFVNHYVSFLEVEGAATPLNGEGLFTKHIDHGKAKMMS